MPIVENIKKLSSGIPDNVKLVAVSKTKPIADILQVYNTGYKIFGENKVQDLATKYEQLPKDIEWHMIGHLQTNKVKYIAGFVNLIHSVDSFKLLKTINKEAEKNNRTINCLLQIHIASEDTKFGFSINEIEDILKSKEYSELANIKIVGLMGMATFTDEENIVRNEYKFLNECFSKLKSNYFYNTDEFKEISMGMTSDYKIAIEEGSTIVRIGTLIFGARNYS